MPDKPTARLIMMIDRPSGPIADKLLLMRKLWPNQPPVIYAYCDVLASNLGRHEEVPFTVNQGMYLAMISAICDVTRDRNEADSILLAMPEIVRRSCDTEFAAALNVFADVMNCALRKIAPFQPPKGVM